MYNGYLYVLNKKERGCIIKIIIQSITNIAELSILKYCDENTAGIIIKNINGFVIPPVKKNKNPNCNIS